MSDLKRKKLKVLVEELGNMRGRHTELVTIYVPAGSSLDKTMSQVKNEQSTAMNIKSKPVKKNVMSALERIIQHLKLYKKTPENGLAIFCGNVSDKEGVSDIEIWAIEPPEPVNTKLYRCDQVFVLDPLEGLLEEKELYGLIVIDKSEATIGLLKGKRIETLKHKESIVPGKTKKGGWCVHEDTLLQLHDGKISKIKDLNGDKFSCYDFNEFSHETSKHNHFFQRKSNSAFEITTKAPTVKIKVTPEHVFFVSEKNGITTKKAEKLKETDRLLISKKFVKTNEKEVVDYLKKIPNSGIVSSEIKSIKKIKPKGFFYDMEVAKYQNFIANGIIIHNSQARYQRIREGLLHDFMKQIGEIANDKFKSLKLLGIIIGGPGPVKEMFAQGDFIAYNLKDKIVGVVDVSYSNEYGLREVVERSEDILSEASIMREKKILDRFFGEFSKDSGLATYGFSEVLKALEEGNLELLLLSEAFDWVKVGYQCSCGNKMEKTIAREHTHDQKCPKCDADMEIVSEDDITDDILKKAEDMGTTIEVISTDTEKGEQLKELGGIAGILRYRG